MTLSETKQAEEAERQRSRANLLLLIFIVGSLVTAAGFLLLHLWRPGEPLFPLSWKPYEAGTEFWRRALDWALWSLAGTLTYLLYEIAHNYPLIDKTLAEGGEQPSYVGYTPWYFSTLVRGPVIALVIMFFLSAADLKLTGGTNGQDTALAFEFSKLSHSVTLVLAFVLGFYSRVARKVLDGITRRLFSRAWAEAHEDFNIELEKDQVVLGESIMCTTAPTRDVTWATSLGTIDSSGRYMAPQGGEHCGAKVLVTAVAKDPPNIAQSASMKLVPFEIKGPSEAAMGSQQTYAVSTGEAGVEWSVSPETGAGSIDKPTGLFTAPGKGKATVKTVSVTATAKRKDAEGKDRLCSNQLEVRLASE